MTAINPYLNFNGTTEEAFNFYKTIFGGEFATIMRFRDMPAGEDCDGVTLSDEDLDKIMHISLPVGGGVLMATDTLESMGHQTPEGGRFSLSLSPDSRDEADRLFGSFAEGGTVEMPLADAFFGYYFGIVQDRFGVRWMINYDNNSK